jgi:uncharacterized protein YigE (DUF2233 family)
MIRLDAFRPAALRPTARLPAAPLLATFLLAACVAAPSLAATCRDLTFEANPYTVCDVALSEDLRLFQSDPKGVPFGSFNAVNESLGSTGQSLEFAMNAGMFHPDRDPVGLLVVDWVQLSPIVTSDGPGNFGLLPNGVFCIAPDRFAIIESRAFKTNVPSCRHATQSGPMLVIKGDLHPRFLPQSDSLNIRNGVGVSSDGQTASFAISDGPVNFHAFARLFRDGLGLSDALYLDGSISRLYAPNIGRHDPGFPLGPIIGTVQPAG